MSEVFERTEILQPGPAQALGALLGVPVPDLGNGAALPLLWHWVYLLDRPAQAGLGSDGHPLRSTITAPPGRGGRRMWAGGRVCAAGPLRCGGPATRRTSVASVQDKLGRSGPVAFVALEHQILQQGRVVIEERQDIAYREAAAVLPPTARAGLAAAEEDPAGPAGPGEWEIGVSPTLLFRFSALTYNAHRIHYDRDYARDVEGYPGLVVHGPLQAVAMAEAARASGYRGSGGDVGLAFDYRLTAPLFDHQGMVASAVRERDAMVTAVRSARGRRTASGTLRCPR